MKGVILAGGLGTRLYPLTKVVNKHLLPVYDRPMIFYPLEMLGRAGIRDILVVTGSESLGAFKRLLARELKFKTLRLSFVGQKGEGGIAAALKLAESFARDSKICVALGDNLVGGGIDHAARAFEAQAKGAKILLHKVKDPHQYGVAEIRGNRVRGIEEKPRHPKSKYAVTGVYFYGPEVFRILREIKPSARGEMEITDVNNAYIRCGQMTHALMTGWWADAGSSHRALLDAGLRVARFGANHGR